MSAPNPEQLTDRPVVDVDGQKLGKVADVYADNQTGRAVWLLVKTGLFGKKETLIPFAQAAPQNDIIQVAYSKDQVKDAPNVEPDTDLTSDEEARLYAHYGLGPSDSSDGPSTGRADGAGDDAMTRSEERIACRYRPASL
jgi:sporulation protein YlmC with PRC-barrel domain